MRPVLSNREIRREVAAILKGISSEYTLAAAKRFGEFDRPVLIAWAPEDRFFPHEHADRLAAAFPNARTETIEDSYTFTAVDQPARTAELIAAFAREPATV
jgi:pimeloyl-ACP methyl ester carboxylesterase